MADKKKGRPILPDPNNQPETVVTKTEPTPELNNTAYGMVKLQGQWMVVRIKYNALTGSVGSPELQKVHGDSLIDAEHEFKIAISNELFE